LGPIQMGVFVFSGSLLGTDVPEKLIRNFYIIAQQDAVSTVSLIFLVAIALLAWMARGHRRQIRSALLMYSSAIFLMMAAAFAATAGLPTGAKAFHTAALLFGGFAMVKLAGIFVFDVVLQLTHLSPPQVLRDVLVAVGYIGVGLWLLSRGGVTLSGIVTTSALMTAVIVFSLQDSLGNMLGGLVLQTEASFDVGDWVKIDPAAGRVK